MGAKRQAKPHTSESLTGTKEKNNKKLDTYLVESTYEPIISREPIGTANERENLRKRIRRLKAIEVIQWHESKLSFVFRIFAIFALIGSKIGPNDILFEHSRSGWTHGENLLTDQLFKSYNGHTLL